MNLYNELAATIGFGTLLSCCVVLVVVRIHRRAIARKIKANNEFGSIARRIDSAIDTERHP